MRRVITILALLIIIPASALAAPLKTPAKPNLPKNAGRLTITQGIVPGMSSAKVEFERGLTSVRTSVVRFSGPPGAGATVDGDLTPIYLIVTGKAPPKAGTMRSLADLTKGLEAAGYEVTKEVGKKGAAKGGNAVEVYIVKPVGKVE